MADTSAATMHLWQQGWRFYRGPRRDTRIVVDPQGDTQVLTTQEFRALLREAT